MRRSLLVLLFLLPSAALASHFGDFYVVPVAGHTPGAFGSAWQTDLIIHNFQTTPVTIEIGLVDSGTGTADNFFPVTVDGAARITVPAGATRVLTDLLLNHRGRAASLGALLVGGDEPFALASRIYNAATQSPALGEIVPVAQEFLQSSSQRAVIPGLMSNANFRSNIGFVAAADPGAPMVVEVGLSSESGASMGTRTFTVPAGTISHLQMSSTTLANTSFDVGTAGMRIVSGSGNLTGYASIVDNRSNNLAFLSSGFPGGASGLRSTFARFLR